MDIEVSDYEYRNKIQNGEFNMVEQNRQKTTRLWQTWY